MGFIMKREDNNFTYNKHYEGALSQGNGYMFLRASFEEGLEGENQGEVYTREFKSVTTEKQRFEFSKVGTYIPKVMGDHPLLNEVVINLPYFLDFRVEVDGTSLDMRRSQVKDLKVALDMKNGVLKRSFTLEDKLTANYERFISRANKHLCLQKISYTALEKDVAISIQSGIDTEITTNGYNHFKRIDKVSDDRSIHVNLTTDLNEEVHMQSFLACDKEGIEIADNTFVGTYLLKAGESITFIKKNYMYTGQDQCTLEDIGVSYDTHFKANEEIWAGLWDKSDIIVEGNERDQLAIRFNIYHLIKCKEETEDTSAICAKGFAGEAYYGRYFWDTEIFMLPFYIYTKPEVAKNLLIYRYHTLEGARENAARYHAKGARYPWQSATTGTEQCSLWEYADNEIHITADIVYGIMHYVQGTGDKTFLYNYGAEIILETARYWQYRVDKDAEGKYNLHNVMGPDEYTAFNKNNSFTNRLVKFNVGMALEVISEMKKECIQTYEALCKKIGFEESEIATFQAIYDHIRLPYNKESSYIPQSENFDEYGEVDIESIWEDKTQPLGMYMTHEKLYRSKVLKQADSLSLIMLFKDEFSKEQIENTYNYFEPITSHDSSLSPINHAIVAGWIGKDKDVERFFDYATGLDFDYKHNGSKDGIHIANCGCIYQFIVRTIAGIEMGIVEQDELKSVGGKLIKDWQKVAFKYTYKGKLYEVVVNKEGTKIKEVAYDK